MADYPKLLKDLGLVILVAILVAGKLFHFVYVRQDWQGPQVLALAALSTLGSVLLFCAVSLLLSPVKRLICLILFDFIISCILTANVVYFRLSGDVLSVYTMFDVSELSSMYTRLTSLYRAGDFLFFLDVLILCAMFPWLKRANVEEIAPSKAVKLIPLLGLVIVGILLTRPGIQVALRNDGNEFLAPYLRFQIAERLGLLNCHIYECARDFYFTYILRNRISVDQKTTAMNFATQWRQIGSSPSKVFGIAKGMNLIVIMVESLQSFPIGLRINQQEITPNLNGLVRRSLYFNNFFSQAGEGFTSDGEFTSLNSMYPLRKGALAALYAGNDFHALPEMLKKNGYRTCFAHGVNGSIWNMSKLIPKYGFEQTFFIDSYDVTDEIALGLADEPFFCQTFPRIRSESQPFFFFLLTHSTHHPYRMPDTLKSLNLGDLNETLIGNYLHSVHYLDRCLGEFVKKLDHSGLLKSSLLVIYGDHTADLGTNRDVRAFHLNHVFEQNPNGFEELDLWKMQHQIPLMIHFPDEEWKETLFVSGGHLDIAPTILNLLGIVDAKKVMLGRDLTQRKNSLVVLRDGSSIDGNRFFIKGGSMEAAVCFDGETGTRTDCLELIGQNREAEKRLFVSDTIIEGNLVAQF